MTAYDLVVLGGGPAGEKAAAQAAYWGKWVAVVERAASRAARWSAARCRARRCERRRSTSPASSAATPTRSGIELTPEVATERLRRRTDHVVADDDRAARSRTCAATASTWSTATAPSDPIARWSCSRRWWPAPHAHGGGDHHRHRLTPVPPAGRALRRPRRARLGRRRGPRPPLRSLVVVGGGAVAASSRRSSRRSVPRSPWSTAARGCCPFMDGEIAELLAETFRGVGMRVVQNAGRATATRDADGLRVELASGEALTPEKVIFATGRVGNTEASASTTPGWRPTTAAGSSSTSTSAPAPRASTRRATSSARRRWRRCRWSRPGSRRAGPSTSRSSGRRTPCPRSACTPCPRSPWSGSPRRAAAGQGIDHAVGRARFRANTRAAISAPSRAW